MVLIEAGANINAQDASFGDMNTPLHKALLQNHYHLVEMLTSKGADLHIRNAEGLTAADLMLQNSRYQHIYCVVDESENAVDFPSPNENKIKDTGEGNDAITLTEETYLVADMPVDHSIADNSFVIGQQNNFNSNDTGKAIGDVEGTIAQQTQNDTNLNNCEPIEKASNTCNDVVKFGSICTKCGEFRITFVQSAKGLMCTTCRDGTLYSFRNR